MQLQKAWDFKVLADELKKEGLPVVEAVLKKGAKIVFEWTKASLVMMGALYAAVGLPILMSVEPMLMAEIDKLDGVQGN